MCVDNMELDLGTVNVQGGMNQLLTQQVRKRKDPPEQQEQDESSSTHPKEHHLVAFLCGFVCTECNTGVGSSLLGHSLIRSSRDILQLASVTLVRASQNILRLPMI